MKKLIFCLMLILTTPLFSIENDGLEQALLDLEPELESLTFALGDAHWTHDDMFEGRVVIFSVKGNLGSHEVEGADQQGYQTKYYVGSFSNETQFGANGLEINTLRVAAIDASKVKELKSNGRVQLIEKGVKLANIQVTRDTPLAQAAYLEIEPVRIYGTVGWSPKSVPELELIAKAQVSVGYAIAHSTKDHVENTSNFYSGYEWGVGARFGRYGQIMLHRTVDGDSQKYDDAAANSREALVRFSYSVDIGEEKLWSLGFSAEKRSFRFGSDYEKSKRYLFQFTRRFK